MMRIWVLVGGLLASTEAWQAGAVHHRALAPHARLAPAHGPRLARRHSLDLPMAESLIVAGQPQQPEDVKTSWRDRLPPTAELKKIVPLAIMFFCILFNYTILRDTKDVLVVTAPGSSAEAIPFLKTWVNLPGAIAFTVVYSAMANRLGRQALFYSVLGPFLAFFGSFAWIIYPLRNALHPVAFAGFLKAALPAGFAAPIAVLQNWTYSLFYLLANMWGSVVVSLLFWGFANEVTTVSEAKKYYPLFGLFANVALVFSGQFVRYVSTLHTSMPAGADAWGLALKLLMSSVVVLGGVIAGCFRYLNVAVLEPAEKAEAAQLAAAGGELDSFPKKMMPKKKKKPSMSFGESLKYLAASKYMRNLATLVICCKRTRRSNAHMES